MVVKSKEVVFSLKQAQFDVLAKLQINKDYKKEALKATVRRLWPFFRRRMIWRRL